MNSPEHYISQLRKLNGLNLEAENASEAKILLKTCRSYQSDLRQLKKEINLDIKEIRGHFKEQISQAASKQHFLMGSILGRKTANSFRANTKRDLAASRDEALRPYQQLKLSIDDVILQFDQMKADCQNLIDEERTKLSSKKQSAKNRRPSESDIIDKIERLGQLKSKGLVTQEEFEAKKNELLSRL